MQIDNVQLSQPQNRLAKPQKNLDGTENNLSWVAKDTKKS